MASTEIYKCARCGGVIVPIMWESVLEDIATLKEALEKVAEGDESGLPALHPGTMQSIAGAALRAVDRRGALRRMCAIDEELVLIELPTPTKDSSHGY